MKIYYIGIIRWSPKPTQELCAVKDASSIGIMTRSTFEQFITLISGAVAGGTDPAARQDVEERDTPYIFHLYRRSEGIAAVVVTDREYPNRVVHKLLSQVADDFLTLYTPAKWAEGAPTLDVPQFKEYIVKYQDPRQADSLIKIQLELDETKIVLHKTIESVLERGEKIDDLVSRSESLSAASKMFYTQAKKQNSCCVIT